MSTNENGRAVPGAPAGVGMRWWIPPMVAGSLAALVRLVHVLDLREGLGATRPLFDAALYDGWARGSMATAAFAQHFAPLQAWMLGFVYAIEPNVLAAQIVQALIGAITVSFVADLGRRLAGPVAGLAGGLLFALYWPAVYFAGELVPSTLFTLLMVLGIWTMVVATQSDRRSIAIAGALILGLSVLARPASLVLLVALVLLPSCVWQRAGRVRLETWGVRGAAVLALVAFVPALLLAISAPITGQGAGFLLVQPALGVHAGNHSGSDGHTMAMERESTDRLAVHGAAIAGVQDVQGESASASTVARHHLARAASFWMESPGAALALQGAKLRALLGGGERSDGKNLHFWRARTNVLQWPVFTSWAPIFALGLVGLWLLRRRPEGRWLNLALASYAVVLLVTVVNECARMPLMAVLAAGAGVTIAALFEHFRARRTRALVGLLVPVIVVGIVSSLDRVDLAEADIGSDAASHGILGDLLLAENRLQEAAAAYQTALTIAEEDPAESSTKTERSMRAALVRVLMRMHVFETADQHLRRLEASHADDVEVLVLRGRFHLWHHEEPKAFPFYRRAVDLDPDDPEALVGLVWCQIHNKAYVTARQNVERALSIRPAFPEAIAAKGVIVLHGERNPRHAKQLFEEALRLDWETAAAHHYLGVVFNGDNNRPRALYHFRETMRLDPHNVWVGRFLNRAGFDFEHPAGTTRPEL